MSSTNQQKQNSATNLEIINKPVTSTPLENNHQTTHPMQIILNQVNFESCERTENVYFLDRPSFTCPYCAISNLNVVSLSEHLSFYHTGDRHSSLDSISSNNGSSQTNISNKKVPCPICIAISANDDKNSNFFIQNLLQHINEVHFCDRSVNNNQSLNISTTTTKKSKCFHAWVNNLKLLQ